MHVILARQQLSPNVTRLDVAAPRIARVRRPGQFVIVRLADCSERTPLTIADADPARGSITLVIQAVGKSTRELSALQPGDSIHDIAGPLGQPTELIPAGTALCIGGGVGTAVVYPIAQGLRQRGARVVSVIGARSSEWIIFQQELASLGDVIVCTDDGSCGRKGFVTDAARDLLEAGGMDIVYAVGPVLNPVMIDGTGMCGGCRVSVGGAVRFACVEGPEFDGHLVDFNELQDRLSTYREFERRAEACAADACRLNRSPTQP